MLDVNLFRNDLEGTVRRLLRKKVDRATVDEVAGLLTERRRVSTETDQVRAQINTASKTIGELFAKGHKAEAEARRAEVGALKQRLAELEKALGEVEEKVDFQL